MVLEKTLESPLDCKEIQPVHSEGDQPWDFFGRNDAKAETSVLWPPDAKSRLIGKDSDAGRNWGQEEKGSSGTGWRVLLASYLGSFHRELQWEYSFWCHQFFDIFLLRYQPVENKEKKLLGKRC